MRCAKCGTENRPGRKFCGECGVALAAACPSCGFGNEPGERFCGGCGASLEARAPAAPAPAASGGERRQLTVLFSDLVDSTALSARLDPEDVRVVTRGYENCCSEIVERYGGVVAQYMGDGVLAFFGYPLAHEDDAERALRAALEIVSAVQKLAPRKDVSLAARVGVATGLVVVGEVIATDVSRQYAVSGETANLAARLQALAQANQVYVSAGTRKLAGHAFEYRDRGRHALKGIGGEVQLWEVVGTSRFETRFDAAHSAGVVPLVGRDHERALLLDRWEQARQGEGQAVMLSGEAGIGKSRLVQALCESVDEPPYLLRYQCLAYHSNSALYPVIRQLEKAAGIEPGTAEEEKLNGIEGLLAEGTDAVVDVAPLFAALLGMADARRYPKLELAPQRLKEKTFSALVGQLRGLASKKPLLLVLEDAHWIDPTSLELFDLIIGQLPELRVLAVITARPEFTAPWNRHSHVTQLALNRLSRRHCAAIIEEAARHKRLPDEVLERILARTDGIPLFVEEQTKMVLESGLLREEGDRLVLARPLQELAIPASLQDSLMARLDRLDRVKDLAQVCAVVGRDVPRDVLAAVSGLEDTELDAGLARLVGSGLFVRISSDARPAYSFKHALIHDAAYDSMLKTRRQELHAKVAHVLESQFAARTATQPELLAFHYGEAGRAELAYKYWREAGGLTVKRWAMREAIAHLERALQALANQPAGAASDAMELETRIALGVPLVTALGYADPRAYENYALAAALAKKLADQTQLFSALWGLWTCHRARLEMHQACELAGELNRLAQELDDPSRLLAAHHAQWTTYMYLGELATAAAHCERGVQIYEPEKHHQHTFIYGGHDPGVCGVGTAALGLCLLGRVGEAGERMDAARKLAQRLGHEPTTAHAFIYSALFAQFLRDADAALAYAELTLEIARRVGLPGYVSAASMVAAWARAAQGHGAGSISEMRRCTENNLFMVAGVTRAYFLALLAETQLGTEDFAGALETIKSALDDVERHRMRFWEPELYRLRGDSLRRLPQPDLQRVERCFRRARDTAREQGARLLELRAGVSLARLLTACARGPEAALELAPLVREFGEAPAISDVLEARRVLQWN